MPKVKKIDWFDYSYTMDDIKARYEEDLHGHKSLGIGKLGKIYKSETGNDALKRQTERAPEVSESKTWYYKGFFFWLENYLKINRCWK